MLVTSKYSPSIYSMYLAQLVKNRLQYRRPQFNPWVGKIYWRRDRLRTPVFWPGEFHGLYSLWGQKASTAEQFSLHYHLENMTQVPNLPCYLEYAFLPSSVKPQVLYLSEWVSTCVCTAALLRGRARQWGHFIAILLFSFFSKKVAPSGSDAKESACNVGDPGLDPWFWKIPWRKGIASHFSLLAWRILWTESMGSHRVGHDWATNIFTFFFSKRKIRFP